MALRFVVTDHALARFVERYAESSPPDPLSPSLRSGQAVPERGDDHYRQILLAELERGVPFGGQVGNDVLYLLPCGDVAAVAWNRGRGFVKTVLTREHAIASMESRGVVLQRAPELNRVIRDAELWELAKEHFQAAEHRQRRNALLRELGYDPAGEAGEIYRAAYRAAQRAALEARRADALGIAKA